MINTGDSLGKVIQETLIVEEVGSYHLQVSTPMVHEVLTDVDLTSTAFHLFRMLRPEATF